MISELLDSSVMPGIQGGPLMHVIAAKAVAFRDPVKPEVPALPQEIVLPWGSVKVITVLLKVD